MRWMSWIGWNNINGEWALGSLLFLDSAWNAEERGLEGAFLTGGGLTEGA